MISNRKQLVLVGIVAFAISVGCGIYICASLQGHAISRYQNFKRGMTKAEVLAAMAVPPGNYTTGPYEEPFGRTPESKYEIYQKLDGLSYEMWKWDDGSVTISFNDEGVIASKNYSPVWPRKSFWSRTVDRMRRAF